MTINDMLPMLLPMEWNLLARWVARLFACLTSAASVILDFIPLSLGPLLFLGEYNVSSGNTRHLTFNCASSFTPVIYSASFSSCVITGYQVPFQLWTCVMRWLRLLALCPVDRAHYFNGGLEVFFFFFKRGYTCLRTVLSYCSQEHRAGYCDWNVSHTSYRSCSPLNLFRRL